MNDRRRKSKSHSIPGVLAFLAILALPLPVFANITAGTGFFVTSDGYFLTCFHVIDGAQRIALRSVDGSLFDAAIVAVDRSYDLAVLKANGKFSPLPIGDATSVRRGTAVMGVGFPNLDAQHAEPKRMHGIISRLSGMSDNAAAFQVTLSVPAGNCGAPVVTHEGNVVGVATRLDTLAAVRTAGESARNINEAAKSSYALRLLDGIPDTRLRLPKPSTRRFADNSELVRTIEKALAIVSVDTNRLIEEEQAMERELAERLRRAREEREARRTEAARKLESDQTRQREVNRLRTTVMNFEQRESSLNHEVMSTQQQLGSVSRDPVDHSALARRSQLERQLNYLQNQLNHTTTSKQSAMNQLQQLQIR